MSIVHLSDAQRVLALLAQGLSGRYLHLKPSASLTGQFRPEAVTTDGAAIYLPNNVTMFDNARHNFGVYRIAVLHQLGFYENGTFEFRMDEARTRIAQLPAADAPGAVRALDLELFFASWQAPALLRRVFMMLEDLRIDVAMRRRYPGARADLARVLAQALATRPDLLAGSPFATLLEGLLQYTLGAAREDLIETDATGLLGTMLTAAAALQGDDADVYDSAKAALVCCNVLAFAGLPRVALTAPGRKPGSEGAAAGGAGATGGNAPLDEAALGAAPVDFRGEVQPELVQRQMRLDNLLFALDGLEAADAEDLPPEALDRLIREHGLKDPSGAQPIGAAQDAHASEGQRGGIDGGNTGSLELAQLPDRQTLLQAARDQRDDLRRFAELDRAALRRMFGNAGAGTRSYFYDEWDFHHQAYLKGWCRLFEHRLAGDNLDFIREVRARHGALARQVKRQFQAIKPESYLRQRRVREGDELDLDGIIESIVDRRAGRTPDEHLYQRRAKALREVAAAFLLDMSASTDDPIVATQAPLPPPAKEEEDDPFLYGYWNSAAKRAPEPARRRVIDVGKEALALMCSALETLGDGYGIYGFSGYGREEVEYYVAKEFEEPLRGKVWSAMAEMKPRRSTRMGPAIRHTLKKLARQEVRQKVMIIVSDGFPQDHDYGPDRTDHEYGIQDTAQALREAAQQGVQAFCVTIDRSGHDYLRRMCAADRYLVIDEVESLPAELAKVYRALTV